MDKDMVGGGWEAEIRSGWIGAVLKFNDPPVEILSEDSGGRSMDGAAHALNPLGPRPTRLQSRCHH
jgi:hypothetical protein